MQSRHLAKAGRHIALGAQQISNQELRMADFELHGRDSMFGPLPPGNIFASYKPNTSPIATKSLENQVSKGASVDVFVHFECRHWVRSYFFLFAGCFLACVAAAGCSAGSGIFESVMIWTWLLAGAVGRAESSSCSSPRPTD